MQYTNTDEDEWVDYPYIGIGIKPHTLNKKNEYLMKKMLKE